MVSDKFVVLGSDRFCLATGCPSSGNLLSELFGARTVVVSGVDPAVEAGADVGVDAHLVGSVVSLE